MRYLYLIFFLSLTSCFPELGQLIDKEKSNSYFISKNGNISYSSNGNWFELGINKCDADIKTFKVLSSMIARDKDFIFYRGIKQKHIDYNSFYLDNGIPKDKNNAYTFDLEKLKPLKGIEPQTFEYLKIDTLNKTWSKDKYHYYLNYNPINVDRQTFRFLNREFSKDKDSLYVELFGSKLTAIKKIKKEPIRINEKYILADSTLYYVGTDNDNRIKLKTINFKTTKKIKVLSKNTILVNNQIIIRGEVFSVYETINFEKVNIDINSFEVISEGDFKFGLNYYKDNQNIYLNNYVINKANPKTFHIYERGFAADDKYVFLNEKILKNVDASSFRKDEKKSIWIDDKGNKFDDFGKKIYE